MSTTSDEAEYEPPRNKKQKLSYLKQGDPIIFHPFSTECSKSPQDCESHALEASLLEDVAQENGGIILKPIRIENAVIKGKLNLRYVTFKSEVSIINSIFIDDIDFSFATFEHSVVFDFTHFYGKSDLRGAHATNDFRVYHARFFNECSFMDVQVDGVFRAEGAHFEDVSFQQAEFAKRVLFCPKTPEDSGTKAAQVCFNGNVNFAEAHIQGEAHFEGALFKQKADFSGVRIDSSAYFHYYEAPNPLGGLDCLPICFGGEVWFIGAKIQGTTFFNGACFEGGANFERAQIVGNAIFRAYPLKSNQPPVRVKFIKKVKFLSAYVKGNIEFDGACFENDADFERIEVDHNAYFRVYLFTDKNTDKKESVSIEFKGLARFLGAHIKGDAEFSGAKFTSINSGHKAHFESLYVGGNAFFDDVLAGHPVGEVIFNNTADFTNAHFKKQAVFSKATFKGEAKFINVDVAGAAFFNKATFNKATNFTSASFNNQANFTRAHFKMLTVFTDARVDGSVFFNRVNFGGKTMLHSARFKSIDLTDSTFRYRTYKGIFGRMGKGLWRRKVAEGVMDLRGATYDHINIPKEGLLNLLRGFYLYKYDRQPYAQLEKALNAAGRDRQAGDVYYEGRCREGQKLWRKVRRKGIFKKLSLRQSLQDLPRALFNDLQRVLFRYGVRPYRLIVYSLLVLLMGTFVFSQPGAIEPKTKQSVAQNADSDLPTLKNTSSATTGTSSPANSITAKQPTYADALNVSFRLFIPFADMPPGSEWTPSNNPLPLPTWVRFYGLRLAYTGYASIHRLFGFILIPLGVAALTGLLHRRDRPGR